MTGLAARLGAEFFLETSRLFGAVVPGDTLTTLIFLTIASRNLRHVDGEAGVAGDYFAAAPDQLRAPVTVYAVAKDLGLSYETVRRHVRRLVDEGVCRRGPDGMVIPAEVFQRPEFARVQARNHDNLLRLAARLAEAGIGPGAGG